MIEKLKITDNTFLLYRGETRRGSTPVDTYNVNPTFTDEPRIAFAYAESNNYGLDESCPHLDVHLARADKVLDLTGNDGVITLSGIRELLLEKAGQSEEELVSFIDNLDAGWMLDGEMISSCELEDLTQEEAEDAYTEIYNLLDNSAFIELMKGAGYDALACLGMFNESIEPIEGLEINSSYKDDHAFELRVFDPQRQLIKLASHDLNGAPSLPKEWVCSPVHPSLSQTVPSIVDRLFNSPGSQMDIDLATSALVNGKSLSMLPSESKKHLILDVLGKEQAGLVLGKTSATESEMALG